MKSILACAAMVLFGFGCVGQVESAGHRDDGPVGEHADATFNCNNPPTCAAECACDEQVCLANHGGQKTCDEEKFQCVLSCK